jgi:CO/xanthine dehydrogenase FAD-binding subunit
MITEYHRPKSRAEAVALLQKPGVRPLGGGTVLNRPGLTEKIAAVDLQALGLDGIENSAGQFCLGAMAVLQRVMETAWLPAGIRQAAQMEVSGNLRQMATVAGSLVSAGGRSRWAAALLAVDARLVWEPGAAASTLEGWLAQGRPTSPGAFITTIVFEAGVRVALQSVARTPADEPLVCAAAAAWPSGRVRLALGGWGSHPLLAYDGPGLVEHIRSAAREAYAQKPDDWAGAEYRREMAGVLAGRCLAQCTAQEDV